MAAFGINPIWQQVIEGLFGQSPGDLHPVPIQPAPYQTAQGGNETDLGYGVRRAVQSPLQAIGNFFDAAPSMLVNNPVGANLRQAGTQLMTTPNQRAAAAQPHSAASVFPTSFADPAYDQADAYASKLTGVPLELLRSIRLNGERSNANQTSSAGANTPYQIIPKTRQGIIKNYGIDPWSSPQNAALGAAYVLREQAGAPKQWDGEAMKKAAMGYFGGKAGQDNPFLSDGGTTSGQYAERVLGPKTGLPAPFLNPYDPKYDQAALGAIGAERTALMTPSSFSVDNGPAPAMPKPEPIPTTDFTQSDEALNRMRPVEMSMKEQLQREHQGFFKGVATALMQNPGNEGIGTFLMRLGGAALGGKLQADDDIQKEKDKFDDKMASYQAAVFNNDLMKAKIAGSEAQAQVQQNNQYAQDNWKMAYDRWTKGSSIDVSGTNAVIRRQDPTTGKTTVDVLPIQSAVDASIAKQTADLVSGMGGRQLAGNEQITSMTNALTARAAIGQMMQAGSASGASAERDAAAAAAPAFYGTFIATHGLTGDLLGPDGAKSLEQTIQKQLMSQQMVPGSQEYTQAHDRLVATELAKMGVADPNWMKKMMQVGSVAGSFQAMDSVQKSRTTTSVDSKGMPTSRTTGPTYNGSGADLFSDGDPAFNQQLADHGYTRY